MEFVKLGAFDRARENGWQTWGLSGLSRTPETGVDTTQRFKEKRGGLFARGLWFLKTPAGKRGFSLRVNVPACEYAAGGTRMHCVGQFRQDLSVKTGEKSAAPPCCVAPSASPVAFR